MKSKTRCPWVPEGDALYAKYHDTEWGVPVRTDRKLFEFLVLESFQSGLSWRTILHKRENFRKAFAGFDPKKVAKFTAKDFKRLMHDVGIVRNRLKIAAAIANAKAFCAVQKEFGTFAKYQWSFVGGTPIKHSLKTLADYQPTIPEARIMAKDMKKRGFKFLGPTTLYAHMQAVGMVNDHVRSCFRRAER
ncbi:MAG: DNA-3-methyladenine glycosylase I [Candidatus Campbellbacteria bacterium]